jgi:hypothetical protein
MSKEPLTQEELDDLCQAESERGEHEQDWQREKKLLEQEEKALARPVQGEYLRLQD